MPRFRLFAGPNGSGKSSLYQYLKTKGSIHTEIYVSADRIEGDIKSTKQFNFNAYRVRVSEDEFKNHIRISGLFLKMKNKNLLEQISLQGGILKLSVPEIDSYIASFIASYLVEKLFDSKQSFCFETVMSHESKIEMLRIANKKRYKTYLYFVFTENYLLNQLRVKYRVEQGGHNVEQTKIRERFFRSFQLLKPALENSSNAFLINNSVNFKVVAEQYNGKMKWLTDEKPEVLVKYAKV